MSVDTLRIIVNYPVIPYTRMTQRGRWVQERAIRYLGNQRLLGWHMRLALGDTPIPVFDKDKRLKLDVTFTGAFWRGDTTNYLKAVEDAANGILWNDDRQIDWACGIRKHGPGHEVVIEVGEIQQ